jgi:hypothetical protein
MNCEGLKPHRHVCLQLISANERDRRIVSRFLAFRLMNAILILNFGKEERYDIHLNFQRASHLTSHVEEDHNPCKMD